MIINKPNLNSFRDLCYFIFEITMVFGEVVEPSTRALLLDDYGEYPETYKSELDWELPTECPTINTLLVAETKFVIELIEKCFKLSSTVCRCEKAGLKIYDIGYDNFLLTCNKNDIITGEIVEKLAPWIQNARSIVSLTSKSSALYQNIQNMDLPVSFIRSLAYNKKSTLSPKLESPNIVTGLGANFLAYSCFIDRPCELYIGYIDGTPLDSINSQPFVNLLEKLNLGKLEKCVMDFKMPSNNLYM